MRQQLAEYRVFWRQFRDTYHSTGVVMPSGRALSVALARFVRESVDTAGNGAIPNPAAAPPARRRILEVGPGTGAVTTQIIRDMRPTDELVLVERNEQFVDWLRGRLQTEPFQRARGRLELLHAAAEDVPEDRPYDLVISGLPFNNFAVESVEQIFAKLLRLLAPGGVLSFFEYVAIRRVKSLVSRQADRTRLRGITRVFHDILGTNELRRDLVLANVPPAWVHHVRFKAGSKVHGAWSKDT